MPIDPITAVVVIVQSITFVGKAISGAIDGVLRIPSNEEAVANEQELHTLILDSQTLVQSLLQSDSKYAEKKKVKDLQRRLNMLELPELYNDEHALTDLVTRKNGALTILTTHQDWLDSKGKRKSSAKLLRDVKVIKSQVQVSTQLERLPRPLKGYQQKMSNRVLAQQNANLCGDVVASESGASTVEPVEQSVDELTSTAAEETMLPRAQLPRAAPTYAPAVTAQTQMLAPAPTVVAPPSPDTLRPAPSPPPLQTADSMDPLATLLQSLGPAGSPIFHISGNVFNLQNVTFQFSPNPTHSQTLQQNTRGEGGTGGEVAATNTSMGAAGNHSAGLPPAQALGAQNTSNFGVSSNAVRESVRAGKSEPSAPIP